MRNLKQTLIFFALVILFITGSAFAATFANPTCVPPNCNVAEPITVGVKAGLGQGKFDSFSAEGIISTTTLRSRDETIVGGGFYSGGLNVATGDALFGSAVMIGATFDGDGYRTSTLPTKDLQLVGNTNIGMGNYCTLSRTQITNGAVSCPIGHYVSWYNPDATGSSAAVRCTSISPASGSENTNFTPTSTGACFSTSAPSLTNMDKTALGNDSCDYSDDYSLSVSVSGGYTPVNTVFQYKYSTSSTWNNLGSSTISIPKIYGSVHSRTYNLRAVATDAVNQSGTSSTINISNTTRPGNCPA